MSRGHALVTGGAGFIGSHLVDVLLARDFEVTVVDNLAPQVHADAECDAEGWPVYLSRKARRIRGDLREAGVFAATLPGVTHLVHLAASVGVGQSMAEIEAYTRNNVLVAATMLEALSTQKNQVRRMAVASSMSIYGEGAYVRPSSGEPVAPDPRTAEQLRAHQWELMADGEVLRPVPTKENKPLRPNSIYAINKRDQEEMFLVVGRAIGIPTIALRLWNAYGSRQALSNPYTGVAAIFISRLLNDEAPLVFEDGRQTRDFVHVLDVAEAFATVLEDERPMWDAFNVASGQAISIAEIADLLSRLLGKEIAPEVMNKCRVGDIRHCVADISKLRRAFTLGPTRELDKGMEELVTWVQSARRPVDRVRATFDELVGRDLVR